MTRAELIALQLQTVATQTHILHVSVVTADSSAPDAVAAKVLNDLASLSAVVDSIGEVLNAFDKKLGSPL